MTERLHFHALEGNGNPLQCSCLENPRDRGAWWAAIYGVAQSRTQLKQLSSSSMLPYNSNKKVNSNIKNINYAAAAKSLQSCPTLCEPIDGSPPGSSIPGILQARTVSHKK